MIWPLTKKRAQFSDRVSLMHCLTLNFLYISITLIIMENFMFLMFTWYISRFFRRIFFTNSLFFPYSWNVNYYFRHYCSRINIIWKEFILILAQNYTLSFIFRENTSNIFFCFSILISNFCFIDVQWIYIIYFCSNINLSKNMY